MNEPTNRPIVVGFGSVPGGTGCTTLAIHAATFAARQGLHTLAISIDPSADMLRRMGVDELYIDAYWIKEDRLKLAFMPPPFFIYDVVTSLPNLGFGGEVGSPDIIFLDLGPGIVQSETVRADFWVVPIQDTRSFESIRSRTYPQGRIRTFFVLSKVPYGAKKRLLSSVNDLVNELPDDKAQVIFDDIANSGLILRTEAECKTIWELSSRSQSTMDIDYFCEKLLNLVKQDRPKDQSAEQEIAKAFAICARDGKTPSSPGPLPSDDVQDETLKAAQELAGITEVQTNPMTHFQLTILSAGDGATAYRLVQERAGAIFYVPSLDKPPLSLSPFQQPVVPPGTYGVAYLDAGGKVLGRPRPIIVRVESREEFQAGIETNPPTQDKPNHKQQELKRRIEQGFQREIERLRDGLRPATQRVVPKASRRKK